MEGNQRALYVTMKKTLYGMLISAVLFYKKLRTYFEEIGFTVNPYNVCVANCIVNGKQYTVVWHVDNLKSSHVDPEVNNDFIKWVTEKYGKDDVGKVDYCKGKIRPYLGMNLDHTKKGKLKENMRKYTEELTHDFLQKIKGSTNAPWTEKLFISRKNNETLEKESKKIFHNDVMKLMFLCKRGQSDVSTAVVYLSSRMKHPTEEDWKKLIKVLSYLKATRNNLLTLEADNDQIILWHVLCVYEYRKRHDLLLFKETKD